MLGRCRHGETAQAAWGLPIASLRRLRVIHSDRLQHFEQKAEFGGSQMDANAVRFVI
jgi:hypothetical protein